MRRVSHDLGALLQVLQKLPNARGVLVTAGGSGAAYCFRSLEGGADDVGHVPVYSVNVQDTTGAGDAFTCGFLSYLLAEVRALGSRRDCCVLCTYCNAACCDLLFATRACTHTRGRCWCEASRTRFLVSARKACGNL